MSSAQSLSKSILLPVRGWVNPNVLACNTCLGQSAKQFCMYCLYFCVGSPLSISIPPYFSSANSGCPMLFICTRIWCVRPVSNRHSTSVTYGYRSNTRQWVIASFALGFSSKSQILYIVRSRLSRAKAPSIVPLSSVKVPHTNALYVRYVECSKNCLPRCVLASGVLAISSSPLVSLSMRCTSPILGSLMSNLSRK